MSRMYTDVERVRMGIGELFAWFFISFELLLAFCALTLLFYGVIVTVLSPGPNWLVMFLICVWYIKLDRKNSSRGYRISMTFRKWNPFPKWVARLLPVTLVKTVDLDPHKNYIFGIHPHGVIGLVSTILSDATGFSTLFPGLVPHMVVVPFFFVLPFFKEVFMLSGAISAEPDAIDHVLSKEEKGRVVAIAVGGANEMADIHPGTMILTLMRRKGFIKMALKHGASLVPVLNFGDNDQLDQFPNPPGSWLRSVQDYMYSKVKTKPVFLYGPKYSLANRVPINTVVGKPIDVQKTENPSDEVIDELQSRYITALRELFNENKDRYSNNDDLTLVIN